MLSKGFKNLLNEREKLVYTKLKFCPVERAEVAGHQPHHLPLPDDQNSYIYLMEQGK
jgi:hypothetical protein